uniref:Lysosomal dipeptide transporter MFSD1 n=1 Tax=Desulfacinum infernum TaxID=35837 RepID=A0A832A030_9BACT
MRSGDVGTGPKRRSLDNGHARSWLVFCLSSLLFVLSQFYRVSNAVIAPRLQEDLALTAEQLGFLSAAFFYAFAGVQIPLGMAIDRFGGRWTMAVLTALGGGGALLFAHAQSFSWAVAGRSLLGVGMAGNLMGTMKLLGNWFPPGRFATLSGLTLSLGTLGNMLAATPLAAADEHMGWRASFVALGWVTMALALLFFLCVQERPQGATPVPISLSRPGSLRSLGILCRDRNYWIISMATFFRYGSLVAVQGLWIGPYMIQQLGFSPVRAGNFLLALNVGLIVGSPLGGWLSDRVVRSRKKIILLGLAVMALDLFGLSLGWGEKNIWFLSGFLFTFGLFGSFGIVMYAHIKELLPPRMTGTALSGINLFTMLGGAALLQSVGWILDHGGTAAAAGQPDYRTAFFLCAVGVSGALAAYAFSQDSRNEKAHANAKERV